MRFESKHSYFKRCVRRSQNFENVCASLANRHQLLQAFLSEIPLYPAKIQIDPGSPLNFKLYSTSVASAINKQGLQADVTVVCQQAVVNGYQYQKHNFIAYTTDECVEFNSSLFGKLS